MPLLSAAVAASVVAVIVDADSEESLLVLVPMTVVDSKVVDVGAAAVADVGADAVADASASPLSDDSPTCVVEGDAGGAGPKHAGVRAKTVEMETTASRRVTQAACHLPAADECA
ncbi:MAG: hypothetical protein E6Q97_00150 [Desulfurellales bacterium]|nr:MAG: hypothetical protein E6Q97_00150 [Desulfurellales bacterium]